MSAPNISGIEPMGIILQPSASFTRPADTTAYASGDLVANSTTAGSVAYTALPVARQKMGMTFLRRCKLEKSTTSTTNASFRVHFFTSSKTFSNGDNGAFSTTRAGYLGAMDVTIDRAFSDGAAGIGVPVTGLEIADTGDLMSEVFWALEARLAYTPGNAEVFTITLDAYPS
jgi:hypothetical protein